jgi:uncharacterized protein YbjT (DUF2867 family)
MELLVMSMDRLIEVTDMWPATNGALPMSSSILVTAATGTVGKHLVPRLLALGHRVRAASRSGKASLGEATRLDFEAPASFAAALDGVDAIYLVVPTGPHHPLHMLSGFVDAAAARGIKIVLQSAIGVDADEAIPFRQLERKIEASGAPYVLLRPNWFFDNFHTYWLKDVRERGLIQLPAGETRTSFVDARDIADVAAAALTRPDFDGEALTLTGAESLTYAEAASVLSAVSGKPIRYEPVEVSQFIASAERIGLTREYAEHLAPIFYPVTQGWVAADSGDVSRVTGRAARRLVDYVSDNAARFV